MARIVIGEGLWSNIRGYLNSMFEELYAAIGTGTLKLYTKNDNLAAEATTRVTTSLTTTKPRVIEIFDETGRLITHTLIIDRLWVDGYYVLDIWSSQKLDNVEINITYS